MAVAGDMAFPGVTRKTRILNAYIGRLHAAAAIDARPGDRVLPGRRSPRPAVGAAGAPDRAAGAATQARQISDGVGEPAGCDRAAVRTRHEHSPIDPWRSQAIRPTRLFDRHRYRGRSPTVGSVQSTSAPAPRCYPTPSWWSCPGQRCCSRGTGRRWFHRCCAAWRVTPSRLAISAQETRRRVVR
jgi:hypothetical protein